jgi:hypothetical protein
MELSEIYIGLGRDRFDDILGTVAMGSLKTFKVYETFKIRARLSKLNRDRLKKAAPKLWARLEEGDQELAKEIAQGSLVSHMDFVVAALDFLEIPHDGHGFFEKDAEASDKLVDGWQARLFSEFKDSHPMALVLLYINHLDWEMSDPTEVFAG